MADLATVNRGVQIAPEVTPGTPVAADTVLGSIGLNRFKPMGTNTEFRSQGNKLATQMTPTGRRWTEFDGTGIGTYDEMTYLLASLIKSVTPTADGTNGKKWTFAPSLSAPDTKQTYTVEQGSSVHAQKCAFGHVIGLTMEMSKDVFNLSHRWRAQTITDDITLTATPTSLTQKIIKPLLIDVGVADTQAALPSLPTGALARAFKATLTYENVSDALFRMFSTDTSFVSTPELAPNITLSLTVDSDDAGMAYLANLTAGSTKFIRLRAVGDVIAGAMASAYSFNLDFSGKLQDPYENTEESGADLTTWTFRASYDATWAKAIEIYVVNELATL